MRGVETCLWRLRFHAPVKGRDRGAKTLAYDPARALEMGAPTSLCIATRHIEAHQRSGGFLPVEPFVLRFEQGGVQGEAATIIVDDRVADWRKRFNGVHRSHSPKTRVEEYTPWIDTRQSRPPGRVSSRENLARNLKALRTAKGLSQEALADAAGIDRTYVSALERRKYSLSIDRLDRIALSLGVEPFVLLLSQTPRDAE